MPCLSDAGVRGSSALGTPSWAFPRSLSLSAQSSPTHPRLEDHRVCLND